MKCLFLELKSSNMICQCVSCELKTLFYNCVDISEIDHYCQSKTEKPYKEGEVIFKQGDQIVDFLYLKEGLVKLYRTTESGEEQIISFGKPFDFVSILSLFSSTTYNYSVAAVSASVVCSFDLSEISKLVQTNGAFAMHLIQTINKSSDRIIINTLDLLQKRLYGRIAYILLYFADEVYMQDEFDLPISRKEISQYIGMTQENVIRAISSLRKDGTIKVFGKSFALVDKKRLMRMRDLS